MEMLTNTMFLKADMWTAIIDLFAKWLVNYGWTIVVFTICLKLVLSPLDILQRVASSKQQRAMSAMQPELEAINQKFAGNKEKINQETAKLYKKYNVNVGGMCLSMILPLIITVVVFFTLYGSIRSYGNEKIYTTYKQLDTAYVQAVEDWNTNTELDKSIYDNQVENYIKEKVEATYETYKKQNSWFWVKNVWKADTNTSQFVDFEEYAKHQQFDETAKAEAKNRYEFITTTILAGQKDNNGYYILIVLAVAVSFLTQFLSARILAPKGQKLNTMNKVMMAIIPLSMIAFVLTSNVVFTLYIITNSIVSSIITTILTLIFRRKASKGNDVFVPKKKVEVVEYSRNYKK